MVQTSEKMGKEISPKVMSTNHPFGNSYRSLATGECFAEFLVIEDGMNLGLI